MSNSKSRSWLSEMLWKPKNVLSLDQLKYLYQQLERNVIVTENNRNNVVEIFRGIAEILIWGDQNDSRVFDFFLEKNMQSYFQKILIQKCDRYVSVQLLQTLNILFENIRNETSLYYLLSNNHVNSLIVLKLDFSDEEVLAYYISFLKTLSFKLNRHTVHFFYNEHLRDFPLYSEAIKFFSHSESMVRIAVRTITLNVFKVDNRGAIDYICSKGAAVYFSNLMWLIGNHAINMDECLVLSSHACHHQMSKLESMVAEHLDHLHYLNDILSLQVARLNDILIDHLLNRLLIPLYASSFSNQISFKEKSPHIGTTMAAFLLSQVFVTLSHPTFVTLLAYFILSGDSTLTLPSCIAEATPPQKVVAPGFLPPDSGLERTGYVPARPVKTHWRTRSEDIEVREEDSSVPRPMAHSESGIQSSMGVESNAPLEQATPEIQCPDVDHVTLSPQHGICIQDASVFEAILKTLVIHSGDSRCFFSLCLLLAIIQNAGVNRKLFEAFQLQAVPPEDRVPQYNSNLVHSLIDILLKAAQTVIGNKLRVTRMAKGSPVRLVTLNLAVELLFKVLYQSDSVALKDEHFASIVAAYESSIEHLRAFCAGSNDDTFLDMFEEEYYSEQQFKIKLSFLLMDPLMLLTSTDTPSSGVDLTRRLPNGETEKARKAMRVYLALHNVRSELCKIKETELPFGHTWTSTSVGAAIDLSNCNLFSCKVVSDNRMSEHFLTVTDIELLLVDPTTNAETRSGWGTVQVAAPLEDIDLASDPADRCSLFVTLQQRSSRKRPGMPSKFQFQDYILCSAAKKCLQSCKDKLRLAKMARVNKLLNFAPPEPLYSMHVELISHTGVSMEGARSLGHSGSVYSTDSDPSDAVVLHSTFMSERDPFSPQPPDSHYIELAPISSSTPPVLSNTVMRQRTGALISPSFSDDDIHLDSHSLQAIIRLHKSRTQDTSEQEEAFSCGQEDETEQRL